MIGRLLYFLLRAVRNMRQTPLLCIAAVGTVAVSLCLVALAALVGQHFQHLSRSWSDEIQVVAYFDTLPAAESLQQTLATVRKLPEVDRVIFVSQEMAFKRFQQRLGDQGELLDGLAADILPASLELVLAADARHVQGAEAVAAHLRSLGSFSSVQYGQEWLRRFGAFLTVIKLAGSAIAAFLLFATLFIVSNTIKLTLYARRDELEIMALVGGTSMFIKTPFLVEGALQGMAGGLLALGASYGFYWSLLREGLASLVFTSGLQEPSFLPFASQGLLVAFGTGIGLCGSLFALRRLVRI